MNWGANVGDCINTSSVWPGRILQCLSLMKQDHRVLILLANIWIFGLQKVLCSFFLCVCVCVCVRERERASDSFLVKTSFSWVLSRASLLDPAWCLQQAPDPGQTFHCLFSFSLSFFLIFPVPSLFFVSYVFFTWFASAHSVHCLCHCQHPPSLREPLFQQVVFYDSLWLSSAMRRC